MNPMMDITAGVPGMMQNSPEAMRRQLLLHMLMKQKTGGGHAGGIAQLGNGLMSAMLMNPNLMQSIKGMFGGGQAPVPLRPDGMGGMAPG